MSKIELKQIFIAHPVKFVCTTVQEFAKLSNISAYVLDDFNDFSYLIEDLRPEVILIHQESFLNNKESFEKGIEDFKDLKIMIISKEKDLKSLASYPLQIIEPFDPKDLCGNIKQLLESESN